MERETIGIEEYRVGVLEWDLLAVLEGEEEDSSSGIRCTPPAVQTMSYLWLSLLNRAT